MEETFSFLFKYYIYLSSFHEYKYKFHPLLSYAFHKDLLPAIGYCLQVCIVCDLCQLINIHFNIQVAKKHCNPIMNVYSCKRKKIYLTLYFPCHNVLPMIYPLATTEHTDIVSRAVNRFLHMRRLLPHNKSLESVRLRSKTNSTKAAVRRTRSGRTRKTSLLLRKVGPRPPSKCLTNWSAPPTATCTRLMERMVKRGRR